MFASCLSLIALAVIGAATYGIGRPLIRGLKLAQDDGLAEGVLSVAAGLVTASLVLTALGLAGWLYREAVGVLSLAAAFWGVGEIGRTLGASRGHRRIEPAASERPSAEFAHEPPVWLRRGLLALAAAVLILTLIAALAPPTAGDALCYHLELPKQFLREHKLAYLPDTDNSTYPLTVEMLYLWALVLDGPVAAQLVHCGLGVLLALAAVLLATPLVGRPWGWCAGCLTLLVPGVGNQMTAPLNDVGLAAFTTLALACWWRACVDEEHAHWYLLAGWMLGAGLGTKHLAILFALVGAAVFSVYAWRQGARRRVLAGAASMLVVAISVSGIWYLRAAWHQGNPVYPFFQEKITGEGRPTLPADKAPLGRGAVNLALAPWMVTMFPERFGGRGHQLGIVFLAALPGLLVCRRLRGLSLMLQICCAYFVCWYMLRQNVRFLLPLVPPACVAVAWVFSEARRMPAWPRQLFALAVAGMLLVSLAVSARRAYDKSAVALGLETRDSYLSRCEPSYAIARWANSLGLRTHILSVEQRLFYFTGQATRESIYRRRTGYHERLTSPGQLSRQLRDEGFTHLLLADAIRGEGIRYNPTLSRLVDKAIGADGGATLECLAEHDFQDADGVTRRYRLVALR
ncbi:MAG TPA: glycosyltransferase family 39 protein [Pirellulales bacterium]|nr:glycosyltransferase family 39 protein [Pirellulales bacterium]